MGCSNGVSRATIHGQMVKDTCVIQSPVTSLRKQREINIADDDDSTNTMDPSITGRLKTKRKLKDKKRARSGEVFPTSSEERSDDEEAILPPPTKSSGFTEGASTLSTIPGTNFIEEAPTQSTMPGTNFIEEAPTQSAIPGTNFIEEAPTQSFIPGTDFIEEAPTQSTIPGTNFIGGATSLRDRDREKDRRYWEFILQLGGGPTQSNQIGFKQEETPSLPKPSFIDISPSESNVPPSKRLEASYGIDLDMTPEERSVVDFSLSMRENFYLRKNARSIDSTHADSRSIDLARENGSFMRQVDDMEGNFDLYDMTIDEDIDLEIKEWNEYLSPRPLCANVGDVYEPVLYES